MSVINQMLKDLDKRQSQQDENKLDYPKIPETQGQTTASKQTPWYLWLIISLSVLTLLGLTLTNWLKKPETTEVQTNSTQIDSTSVGTDETSHQQKQLKQTLVPAVAHQSAAKKQPSNAKQELTTNDDTQANTAAASKTNHQSIANARSANQSESSGSEHISAADTQTPTTGEPAKVEQNAPLVKNTKQATISQSEPEQSKPEQTGADKAIPIHSQKASAPKNGGFMSINPTQQSNPKIAQNKLEQAKALLDKGRFVKAEQLLQSALTLQPDLHKARITWMSIRYGEQNLPAALAVLQQGIKNYPEHLPYRLLAARILLEMNKPQVAWTLVENQHPAINSNASFYQFKASLAQQLNLPKQALKNWQALLQINPAQANWQLGAAIAAEQSAQPEQAVMHYQKAFNLSGLSQASRQFIQQKLASLAP